MKLLQMVLQGSSCCRQPEMSLEGRSRLSARQGSCLALCESGGGAWRLQRGRGGGRGRPPPRRGKGAWPSVENFFGFENKKLEWRVVPAGLTVCERRDQLEM